MAEKNVPNSVGSEHLKIKKKAVGCYVMKNVRTPDSRPSTRALEKFSTLQVSSSLRGRHEGLDVTQGQLRALRYVSTSHNFHLICGTYNGSAVRAAVVVEGGRTVDVQAAQGVVCVS